ncbi:MAG TPA: FAD-dependent monooxygenase, partial [Bacteroidales bacterium]|nr:FAD-dependent monooxygenase [Bacteroidales bacterium]
MGYRSVRIKLPTEYSEEEIRATITKQLKIKQFSYRIDSKSLDARKKANIHWEMVLAVSSPELRGEPDPVEDNLEIPVNSKKQKVLVTGSGPAGFFAAFVLQKAGFETTIIERGKDVDARSAGIAQFEAGGSFDPSANYAFGEGGAGTFSDGKLTSRSKRISTERRFITNAYIKAGAPEEIAYMNHPHLGSDNLKTIVKALRQQYRELGGNILFETRLDDLFIEKDKVVAAITNRGEYVADRFILATGHSAFETFRMLMRHGVKFRPKNFAIGSRMEHPRQIINKAQWGMEELPGVKAAEYRLTANPEGHLPVYTFCMCPGGIIVPSTAYEHSNIVNGMSLYNRDMAFSNAACVASVNPYAMIGEDVSAQQVLDWLERLETQFYESNNGYEAPFCSIKDFIMKSEPSGSADTSYPLGLKPAPL